MLRSESPNGLCPQPGVPNWVLRTSPTFSDSLSWSRTKSLARILQDVDQDVLLYDLRIFSVSYSSIYVVGYDDVTSPS